MPRKPREEQQPASTILLMDVLAAWEYVEEEHGVKLRLVCERSEGNGNGQLSARFEVNDTSLGEPAVSATVAHWSWPTVHHKTFLGMLLWLVHQIDREVTASRCLAQLPLFPGARPLE